MNYINNINCNFRKNTPTNEYDVQKSKILINGIVTIFGKLLSFIETIFLMLLLFFYIMLSYVLIVLAQKVSSASTMLPSLLLSSF